MSRCCANCIHAFAAGNGALFCRRNPPQVVPVVGTQVVSIDRDTMQPAKSKKAGDIPIALIATTGFNSQFPQVQPDWDCGQHSSVMGAPGGSKLVGLSH